MSKSGKDNTPVSEKEIYYAEPTKEQKRSLEVITEDVLKMAKKRLKKFKLKSSVIDPKTKRVVITLSTKSKRNGKLKEIWSFDLNGQERQKASMAKPVSRVVQKPSIRRFPRTIRFPRLPPEEEKGEKKRDKK